MKDAVSRSSAHEGEPSAAEETPPRFEFRVWGDHLDELAGQLGASSDGDIRKSTDTYFVSTATVDVNPKARADLLDIKTLLGVQDGCEQWEVHTKLEFPVAAHDLIAELFQLVGVDPPELARPTYTLGQLIDELVAPHPDLAAVEVTKVRRITEVAGCIGEVSDVTIEGRSVQTVAIEAADLGAVVELRRRLGLAGASNVSYPRAIRNAIGQRFAIS